MKHARINSLQPNSAVSYKVLSDRAKLSFDTLGAISGGEFDDNNEKHLLVVKLMQQNFSFFQGAADAAGLFKEGKVSVKDAINIKALARLSMNEIRDLRTCFLLGMFKNVKIILYYKGLF